MTIKDSKFEFGTDYQEDLLRFTVTDRDGWKALELYQDSYFVLTEHAVVAHCLKKYWQKKRRIPGPVILKEELNDMFKHKDYVNLLTVDDRKNIINLVSDLYGTHARDGEEILSRCEKFASYIELKDTIETINLKDFAQYEAFATKVVKAIRIKDKRKNVEGTFLIRDIKNRQLKRLDSNPIVPTPFRQINDLTNAGGYAKGSIIVILDKPKQSKTAMLIQVARGYLRQKKNVFIADIENGEDELSIRLEQSVSKKTKKQLLSGEFDKLVQKVLRKYKRLGGDVYIKRFPAFSSTYDIQAEMDRIYREYGIRFQILLVDYAGMMSSTTKKDDDTQRISDVYIDLANLALFNDLHHIWTPHHVVREAGKRESTRYRDTDIAKCIDIVRHAQAIYGLNRNDDERENGVMRMELMVQRDGKQFGRAVFHADQDCQRMDEFTVPQRKEYDEAFNGDDEDSEPKSNRKRDI